MQRERQRETERDRQRQRDRERQREETVDHIVPVCLTIVNTEYFQIMIQSLLSYAGYYVKTSTCRTQKNGMKKHHQQ